MEDVIKGIFVAYPKSGSTWLKFMLANVLRPDVNHNFDTTTALIPCMNSPELGVNLESHSGIYRSHDPIVTTAPIVYLYRHPVDVLISFYYHMVKFHAYPDDIDTFVKQMKFGQDWRKSIDWWFSDEARKGSDIYYVRYESLQLYPEGHLMRICNFLDIETTPAIVKDAVRKTTLLQMSDIEREHGLGKLYNSGREDIPFVRRGVERENLLSEKAREIILDLNQNHLIKLNYASSSTHPSPEV